MSRLKQRSLYGLNIPLHRTRFILDLYRIRYTSMYHVRNLSCHITSCVIFLAQVMYPGLQGLLIDHEQQITTTLASETMAFVLLAEIYSFIV